MGGGGGQLATIAQASGTRAGRTREHCVPPGPNLPPPARCCCCSPFWMVRRRWREASTLSAGLKMPPLGWGKSTAVSSTLAWVTWWVCGGGVGGLCAGECEGVRLASLHSCRRGRHNCPTRTPHHHPSPNPPTCGRTHPSRSHPPLPHLERLQIVLPAVRHHQGLSRHQLHEPSLHVLQARAHPSQHLFARMGSWGSLGWCEGWDGGVAVRTSEQQACSTRTPSLPPNTHLRSDARVSRVVI